MNTILLATDGSPSAESATGEAIELALATGSRLCVVTAWKRPAWEYGIAPVPPYELDAAAKAHAEDALAKAFQAAREEGVAAERILRRGEAAHEVCTVAEEIGADLIVVGSHGWNALQRLVLGSVSARVLHEAPCPVVVVRAASREVEPVTSDEAEQLVAT
jgi:nucleotide-binding universal stress UspA family protein